MAVVVVAVEVVTVEVVMVEVAMVKVEEVDAIATEMDEEILEIEGDQFITVTILKAAES